MDRHNEQLSRVSKFLFRETCTSVYASRLTERHCARCATIVHRRTRYIATASINRNTIICLLERCTDSDNQDGARESDAYSAALHRARYVPDDSSDFERKLMPWNGEENEPWEPSWEETMRPNRVSIRHWHTRPVPFLFLCRQRSLSLVPSRSICPAFSSILSSS